MRIQHAGRHIERRVEQRAGNRCPDHPGIDGERRRLRGAIEAQRPGQRPAIHPRHEFIQTQHPVGDTDDSRGLFQFIQAEHCPAPALVAGEALQRR